MAALASRLGHGSLPGLAALKGSAKLLAVTPYNNKVLKAPSLGSLCSWGPVNYKLSLPTITRY